MLAIGTDPPDGEAAAASDLIWRAHIPDVVPLLNQIWPDAGYAAVPHPTGFATFRAASPVVAAEGRIRTPLEFALMAPPLHLLLVPEADGRRRQRVVLVPLPK